MGKPLEGDGILTPVKCLMGNSGNIAFGPLCLYLLGRGSPYLHNGVQYSDNGQGGVSYLNQQLPTPWALPNNFLNTDY